VLSVSLLASRVGVRIAFPRFLLFPLPVYRSRTMKKCWVPLCKIFSHSARMLCLSLVRGPFGFEITDEGL